VHRSSDLKSIRPTGFCLAGPLQGMCPCWQLVSATAGGSPARGSLRVTPEGGASVPRPAASVDEAWRLRDPVWVLSSSGTPLEPARLVAYRKAPPKGLTWQNDPRPRTSSGAAQGCPIAI